MNCPDAVAPTDQRTVLNQRLNALGLIFCALHTGDPSDRHNQTVTQKRMSDRIDPSFPACPNVRRLGRWIIYENPPNGIRSFTRRKSFLMSWRIVTCLTRTHSGAPDYFKVSSKTKLFSPRESSGRHLWFSIGLKTLPALHHSVKLRGSNGWWCEAGALHSLI